MAILEVFGQNGIFSKKCLEHFLRLKALINGKVLEKSNEGIPRKMQTISIFGHFGPKWPILDSFWLKWAKQEFFQKSAWKIFSRLQALTNCKFSKKSNERFSSNRVTDGRTCLRTYVNP